MKQDVIDTLIAQWAHERPELDSNAMAVVGRILRLGALLEKRVNDALVPFGLALWGFDILATLRRHGAPYAMTPTALSRSIMLSSGAMTNRIDRLEALGFVERRAAPEDRRSMLVCLTNSGRKTVDRAVVARFEEANDALRTLNKGERHALARLLKTLMLDLNETGGDL